MRQQRVQEVERRSRAGVDPGDEAVHDLAPVVDARRPPAVPERLAGLVGREVLPVLIDRRQRRGQIVRQHDGQVHHRQVPQHGREPGAERGAVGRAERLRTQVRQRLLHVHSVPAAQQREEVRRMVGRHGEAILRRAHAREHGRHGVRRQTRHRGRVAEPGCLVGQRREVGERRAIDVAVAVQQRRKLELVEDDEDDRGSRGEAHAFDSRDLFRRRQQAAHAGREQEGPRHDEHGRGQEGGEQPDRREAAIGSGCGGAGQHGQRDQRAARRAAQRLEREEHDRGGEAGDDRVHRAAAPARAPGQRRHSYDEQAGGRPAEAEQRNEDQQVARPGVVRDEELGAAAYEIENRLRHGKAPETDDVQGLEAAFRDGLGRRRRWRRQRGAQSAQHGRVQQPRMERRTADEEVPQAADDGQGDQCPPGRGHREQRSDADAAEGRHVRGRQSQHDGESVGGARPAGQARGRGARTGHGVFGRQWYSVRVPEGSVVWVMAPKWRSSAARTASPE